MSDTTLETTVKDKPDPVDDDEIVIHVVRQQKPVKITLEDGTVKNWTLREMMGPAKDKWLNFVQTRAKFEGGIQVGFNNYEGMESRLISMCLYDENDKPVDQQVIEKWSATVKAKLFLRCQTLSALNQQGVEQAKNV